MSGRDQSQNPKSETRNPLITRTSILILSSFIIGIAVQRTFPPEQVMIVLTAGVTGMLAYIALDYVSANRAIRREIEADEQSVEMLEGRLNRHVPPSMQGGPTPQPTPKQAVDWQTLVAVAEKSRP